MKRIVLLIEINGSNEPFIETPERTVSVKNPRVCQQCFPGTLLFRLLVKL